MPAVTPLSISRTSCGILIVIAMLVAGVDAGVNAGVPDAGSTASGPSTGQSPATAPASGPLSGTIVFIGGSITQGEGATQRDTSYVGLIKAKAAAAHEDVTIINQGRSGWTSGAFRSNAKKLAQQVPADTAMICFLLGTNDARDKHQPLEIATQTADNLVYLMDVYGRRAPRAQFVFITLQQVYPQKLTPRLRDADYNESTPAKIAAINQAFRTLARDRGLRLVDAAQTPGPDHSRDGVHPDDTGHAALADLLWPALHQPAPPATAPPATAPTPPPTTAATTQP